MLAGQRAGHVAVRLAHPPDPRLQRKFHTGIDIGVGYGTPIHAADSGTVIYATWMGGYGNVDHRRPRRRPLDAVRAPVVPRRRHRRRA